MLILVLDRAVPLVVAAIIIAASVGNDHLLVTALGLNTAVESGEKDKNELVYFISVLGGECKSGAKNPGRV